MIKIYALIELRFEKICLSHILGKKFLENFISVKDEAEKRTETGQR